ncbi:hypothetical protein A2U01_0022576 [Trifolium medium]|uniref:Uncharacterized protein n=1 Tax=Trifolium medium TaxID=97028 RepID=A0A392NQY7_9FABA|nr:hypothetical protein [Trifolium medium]
MGWSFGCGGGGSTGGCCSLRFFRRWLLELGDRGVRFSGDGFGGGVRFSGDGFGGGSLLRRRFWWGFMAPAMSLWGFVAPATVVLVVVRCSGDDFDGSDQGPLRNQIANVDFLLVSVVSSGLHRAGRFGGLQFAQICVECVMAVRVFFFPERVWSGKGSISG